MFSKLLFGLGGFALWFALMWLMYYAGEPSTVWLVELFIGK